MFQELIAPYEDGYTSFALNNYDIKLLCSQQQKCVSSLDLGLDVCLVGLSDDYLLCLLHIFLSRNI